MRETMTGEKDHKAMTRRQALKGLVALVGGTVGAAELGPLARAAMADTDAAPRFLDADQFAMLGRIVDLMIPDTDTPGAYRAGVHRFIDMMLAEYASADSQAVFLNRNKSEAYRMLKGMILFGYYTSETGASVELRFNPIPGTTPGCVPVDTFDRAPYRAL